ncbi:hypothetical protein C7974DRAFT_174317 [Boeremia exigua]|uniref:uncharacterized protein n=1 Tax=Boeremia exigua TaxID=749465 RepID=UPI001E8D092C|nr:uncharacterized protein C7974DRAFT_174317 [Boeremia exigua]KAH6633563.1 hypothetical protein C7974DRAFT_174317 [Boeremia exigua]
MDAVQDAVAAPAEPLLASSLVDAAALGDVFDSLGFSAVSATARTRVLRTGTSSLDLALGATLQSGRVVALSSEISSQRDALAQSLIADCLVTGPDRGVAIIDTMGNFDVVGLYTRMLRRLEDEPRRVAEMGEEVEGESEAQRRERVAAAALDRVKIMRVFDFVGVREAVSELRDGLEGRAEKGDKGITSVDKAVPDEKPPPQKRTEIADSEDEDDDLDTSGDEMLFDTAPPPKPAPEIAAIPPAQTNPPPRLNLILIDNLAHVLTPLLKKDSVSATTLATTFLPTLSHLTRTHALHTLLLNPCTTPRAPSPPRQVAQSAQQQQQHAPTQTYAPQPPPPPSVFSSSTAVPVLLGLLARYADAHVLVTRVPRGKMDARVFYAEDGGRERGKKRGVRMVDVLEVVADRWGERVGAWGVFEAEGGS